MTKIKCVISYDGTHFSGMQIQPNNRTVEGEIKKALAKIHKGESIRIYASGRTDAGVHAIGQTFHFETDYKLSVHEWKRALNALLPADLHVNDTKQVPDSFHARFDATEKEYRYYILNAQEKDVFKQNYVYQYPYQLDINMMQQAARYFKGQHDFTTFSSAKSEVTGSKVRTLYDVSCYQDGKWIEFILKGNGFLYNMVRIIVGTLLEVGRGKLEPSEISHLFAKEDRQFAGDTVPPQGLYLWNVTYKEES
ncbi:tRNA pseudouridine(38-40) synthase TruA [Lentibacillus sp. CBA3610]|uniref:tRNA pseudouridine(38-40) synthase TruA n=1 Tax=Lentibacillus sp. CBA3610 TaxID=2518176 RepID=UPI001595C613|nr:tRNA pseudouridine(38-40) synthase TruA [Lentibacillus sp. CBA3610]QKY70972.1 tRNA pseudouridine(38-40) synthase TruA [Lentibacillus sp. CBA3610]